MKASRLINSVFIGLLGLCGLLVLTPLYDTPVSHVYFSVIKVVGLCLCVCTSFMVYLRFDSGEPQRLPWGLLSSGMMFFTAGQCVLAYHQLILKQPMAYPSLGDPLFVLSSLFNIGALFCFGREAFRSGFALGAALTFWRPALVIVALFVVGFYPLMVPIIDVDAPWVETFLNVFYPVAGFACLALCGVMLRVGLRFRGGKLLWVWVCLTLGFGGVLISDILFSFLASMDRTGAIDFLYTAGYLFIARGILFQLDLMRS
jgi:hypothetical protein